MTDRPRLFLASKSINGLRTVDDLRRDIESGGLREDWDRLLASAEQAIVDGPILIDADLPDRRSASRKARNPDALVCVAAGEQLMRAALAHLVTGRDEFKASAMAQLEVLYDPERWPDWVDQAHLRFGKVDLRTGTLSRDIGVAYDWLAASLTEEERAWVIEGLDRRAIQPYLAALKDDPWWTHDLHNWLTVIVGGLGVAGMALDGDHPDAQKLIDFGVQKMEEYLLIYGPDGEFNESVGYSSANRFPIYFYLAHRYWSGGKQNRLQASPFPEMCEWILQTTVPAGKPMAFGDSWPERVIDPEYIGAVAAANQDGVLQWFYAQYRTKSPNALEFIAYDPRVKLESPEGKLTPFKTYRAQGRLAISRTDWNPQSTACVVYGKAGREDNHDHNDLGQLCIDGFGDRLITDPGSPSTYPPNYFEAHRSTYYNSSALGHNVLMFDREEQKRSPHLRGEQLNTVRYHGETIAETYVPGVGGAWKMNLTPVYDGVVNVTRTVLHLYPGYVAVLDEAELTTDRDISLRWHTIDRAEPDGDGRFVVLSEKAKLAGMIVDLGDVAMHLARHEHEYPAATSDAVGDVLEARHESYIEATLHADRCRVLTLFCVKSADATESEWTQNEAGWSIDDVQLSLTDSGLELSSADGSRRIAL